MKFNLHPVTRKRLQRFREFRRAYVSFWLFVGLYGLSLCSELISNSRPYYVRLNNRSFFPIVFTYSEDDFLGNGIKTRPDYHAIREARPECKIIFPPIPHGPRNIIRRAASRYLMSNGDLSARGPDGSVTCGPI